jgi:hypothetical protein
MIVSRILNKLAYLLLSPFQAILFKNLRGDNIQILAHRT